MKRISQGALIVFLLSFPLFCRLQNLPPINVVIADSSATQGYFFLSPYTNSFQVNYDRSHQILDQYGRLIFYQIIDGTNPNTTIDFKLQPNGQMTYFNLDKKKWFFMDSTFQVVDSIQCSGFETDQHDLQILPGNHYLLIGLETRLMNLTSYHWFGFSHNQPGSSNAEVEGVVIQEFDENKSLVFEWKSHDHFLFGDVDQKWLFNPNKVDWTHANAVELDLDGNILLSMRHFDEITKIDHSTGNIIWRLGGKQNQYTFPNDPVRFTGQHDIRRVSDTSLSMFDNGQYTVPQLCRGIEYALDETNKIATLVWEYIYDSAMYSMACGNHQYIENGNHLIDFGFCSFDSPWMVVVKPDKSKVLEISFPDSYISYRAFNYTTLPWTLRRPVVECQKTGDEFFLVAEPGHPEYRWSTGATTESIPIIQPGEYWVFVPYGTGFLSSERIVVEDITNPCLFTGTPAPERPSGISVRCMPNPATDFVSVSFTLSEMSRVVIHLTTVQGKVIKEIASRYYPAGTNQVTIDVSNLASGMYFLSFQTDKMLVTKLLTKQSL